MNTATISADPSSTYTITFVRTDETVPITMVMPEQAYATNFDTVFTDDDVTVYWDDTDTDAGGSVEVEVAGDRITDSRERRPAVPPLLGYGSGSTRPEAVSRTRSPTWRVLTSSPTPNSAATPRWRAIMAA